MEHPVHRYQTSDSLDASDQRGHGPRIRLLIHEWVDWMPFSARDILTSSIAKYIFLSVLLFAVPVLYNGLGSPYLSRMVFPEGIPAKFAQSDQPKPIKVLGTGSSPFCAGPAGKIEQEISSFRKDVVAELHRVPTVESLKAEVLHQSATTTPNAVQPAAVPDDTANYKAQFDAEENSRRLAFFNISQGLWFLSLIAIGIGVWAAFHACHSRITKLVFALVTLAVLMPPLVAFVHSYFGDDVHDKFRESFIHNDESKDHPPEAYIQKSYSGKVDDEKNRIITQGTTERLDDLLNINTYLGFGSLGLIFWSMAALASRLVFDNDEIDAKDLQEMRHIFQYALFAVGAVYSLGIISQISLDNWAVLFARPYDKCLSLIIDEFRTFISSTYLIIILFAFGPAFLAWRFRTKAIERQLPPDQKSAWMKDNGLDVSTLDFARSVVAVLLPVVIPHVIRMLPNVL